MSHFKLTYSKKMINLQYKNGIYHFGSKFYCERYDTNLLILKREERKPTRCNNIDDLLSIVDVDY